MFDVDETAIAEEHGADGHEPADLAMEEAMRGARAKVADLRRPDGILTGLNQRGAQSVLQRAMTAVEKDGDYRQELKTAFFLSTDEADRAVAAINEALRYGCSLTPIVDWVVARSSGTHGGRLKAIFETISHTTFTTNYTNAGKKRWWQGDNSDRNRNSRSPLA